MGSGSFPNEKVLEAVAAKLPTSILGWEEACSLYKTLVKAVFHSKTLQL
jgi:hypothetical protein